MEQNLRRFDACIFDLDGTLANTLASIAYFGNSTAGIWPAGNPGGDL